MESEQILSAVTQLLEEQKQQIAQYENIYAALIRIDKQVNELGNSLTIIKSSSPDPGTEKLQEDIDQIKKQLSEMPRNIIQQKRYLFFPEYNAKEYYSAILKWVFYMLMATYAYWLLKFWLKG
ncbi:hypothetical protein [Parafilimonas sp.]|jgi:hypothetical protein|uniref:hypothetical protein n=1 Tax=Parafilimonas sp. TaxID=1969739 RepID=UPI003F7ECD6C